MSSAASSKRSAELTSNSAKQSKNKVQIVADDKGKATSATANELIKPTTRVADQDMSEQQYQMARMYTNPSSSTSRHPSVVPAADPSQQQPQNAKNLTADQNTFVNVGLTRWLQTRKAWKGGKDAEAAKRAGAEAIASTSSSSSSSSSGGKTQLPHALSSHAHPSKPQVAKRDGSSSEEEDEVGSTDQDEFVAGDSDSDADGYDINADVPAILVARDTGAAFNPRVKLGHMVDILNVCWEEESE